MQNRSGQARFGRPEALSCRASAGGKEGWGAVSQRVSMIIAIGLSLISGIGIAARAEDGVRQAAVDAPGKTTLPVPRFVSLKSDKVNVRKGPSTDQSIVWVFSRAGLPVEVIAESDNWRRVRDSEGADGWVFHSLLSARRTVLVTPWSKGEEHVKLYNSKSTSSRAVAELQSGVLGNVMACDGEWCQVSVDDYSGYVQQDKLWGVYKGEEVK
jgi:SH3-like domain-containing protein